MRGSGVDAAASEHRVGAGVCRDLFSRLLKCSCHLDKTDALSDSSLPSMDVNGVDVFVRFRLNLRKLANASLISPHSRCLSPEDAISSAHCCLSCLSDLLRGPVRLRNSSKSPLCIAFLRWSIMERVACDTQGFLAYMRGPRTYLAAESRVFLYFVHRPSVDKDSGEEAARCWEAAMENSRLTTSLDRSERFGAKRLLKAGTDLFNFNLVTPAQGSDRSQYRNCDRLHIAVLACRKKIKCGQSPSGWHHRWTAMKNDGCPFSGTMSRQCWGYVPCRMTEKAQSFR